MQAKKFKYRLLASALSICIMSIAFSTSANAQNGNGMMQMSPADRATAQTNKMKTELSLTDAETTQVSAINLKYAQKADSLYKAPGDRSEKMPAMQSIQSSKMAEMQSVLTPDQYTKYQAMVKEMMDKAKAHYQQ